MINRAIRTSIRFVLVSIVLLPSIATAQQIAVIGITDIKASDSMRSYRHADRVVKELTENVADSLLATRKFKVLSRAKVLDKFDGRDLSLAGFYEGRYAGPRLQQVGLDYLLKLEVQEFVLEKESASSGTGSTARVALKYSLIAVSGDEDIVGEIKTEQHLPYHVVDQADFNALLSKVADKTTNQLSLEITKALHPIRVSWIREENAQPILNYGKGLLAIGDRLAVYSVLDQDGKPIEEFSGEKVGEIEVVEVDAKFAYTRAIKGYNNLQAGQVAQVLSD